jgi:hypothetical protein
MTVQVPGGASMLFSLQYINVELIVKFKRMPLVEHRCMYPNVELRRPNRATLDGLPTRKRFSSAIFVKRLSV